MVLTKASIFTVALCATIALGAAVPSPSDNLNRRIPQFDPATQAAIDRLQSFIRNGPSQADLERQAKELELVGFENCRPEAGVVQCDPATDRKKLAKRSLADDFGIDPATQAALDNLQNLTRNGPSQADLEKQANDLEATGSTNCRRSGGVVVCDESSDRKKRAKRAPTVVKPIEARKNKPLVVGAGDSTISFTAPVLSGCKSVGGKLSCSGA